MTTPTVRQDFAAGEASSFDIANALERTGVVMIRGALDPAVVAAVRRVVAEGFALRDARAARGAMTETEKHYYTLFRSIAAEEVAVDGKPAFQFLITPLTVALATLFLGDAPRFAYSYFRASRADIEQLVLPFHQDSRIVATIAPHLGAEPRLLNAWIPLEACGIDRPGLEVVNRKVTALLPPDGSKQTVYGQSGTEIGAATVFRLFSEDALWHPAFEPGDMLLFSGTTIHRTFARPEMHGERLSIDIRMLARRAAETR